MCHLYEPVCTGTFHGFVLRQKHKRTAFFGKEGYWVTAKKDVKSYSNNMRGEKTWLVFLLDCPFHLSNELQQCSLMSCVGW